jgi:hypothetical protein
VARTWILTGSPDNHAATRDHDFTVIGLKERNRNRALEIEHGDRFVWKLAFQGQIRAVSGHDAGVLMDQLTAAPGARA